jgi:hypothetical protein
VIAAWYLWRAGGPRFSSLTMMLILGLGLVFLKPDFGPILIRLSQLKVSIFPAPAHYSTKTLCTVLPMAALGFLSYWCVAKERRRAADRVLLIAVCCAVLLMLPWGAFVWKAIPALAALQFPFRLCGILTVAVAGLMAVALDNCFRNLPAAKGSPSRRIFIFLVCALIGSGVITWRIDWLYVNKPPRRTPVQYLDLMYASYVFPGHLAKFGKLLDDASKDGAQIPAETRIVRAEFTEGQGAINVVRNGPRELHVSAQCLDDARVKIGLVYMPLWKIVPTSQYSHSTLLLRTSDDGLLEVILGPGQHEFNLVFDGGLPEKSGVIVTLVSIIAVVIGTAVTVYCKWLRREDGGIWILERARS